MSTKASSLPEIATLYQDSVTGGGDGVVAVETPPELLGVVVKRTPDAEAYGRAEPALIEQLLEVRRRLVEADLGEGIATAQWGAG